MFIWAKFNAKVMLYYPSRVDMLSSEQIHNLLKSQEKHIDDLTSLALSEEERVLKVRYD